MEQSELKMKRSFPSGRWTWIPDRPQDKPPFDWQSRMPVTNEMREFYCEACVAYDNSDGSGDELSFEEVVILQYAAERLAELEAKLATLGRKISDEEQLREQVERLSAQVGELNPAIIPVTTPAGIAVNQLYYHQKDGGCKHDSRCGKIWAITTLTHNLLSTILLVAVTGLASFIVGGVVFFAGHVGRKDVEDFVAISCPVVSSKNIGVPNRPENYPRDLPFSLILDSVYQTIWQGRMNVLYSGRREHTHGRFVTGYIFCGNLIHRFSPLTIGVQIQGWSLTKVHEIDNRIIARLIDFKFDAVPACDPRTRFIWNTAAHDSWKNPRTLLEFHRSPGLLNAAYKTRQREDGYTYTYGCDPIEQFSLDKLRGSIIFLFGILLLFGGGFLMSYGQRVWDLKHAISFWVGWASTAFGTVGTLGALLVTLITHLGP